MISSISKQSVILLHGLAANRLAMFRLACSLAAHGYHVANWGYASIRNPIESQVVEFRKRLERFLDRDPYDAVHLVTHSMGGIIVRRAFSLGRPANLGRLVMLGPPNAGSHVARTLARPLGRLCPPLIDLSDSADSYVNRLVEPEGLDLGIIAAAYDRVVKLESTFLPCQRDHIVLPGHHGTLPWRRETVRQVLHYLQYGRFRHEMVQSTQETVEGALHAVQP